MQSVSHQIGVNAPEGPFLEFVLSMKFTVLIKSEAFVSTKGGECIKVSY